MAVVENGDTNVVGSSIGTDGNPGNGVSVDHLNENGVTRSTIQSDENFKTVAHHKLNSVSEEFGRETARDIEEMLSKLKLNPMAKEFVPPSHTNNNHILLPFPHGAQFGYDPSNFIVQKGINGNFNTRKKNVYGSARRKTNTRTSMAQQAEVIRRTVYVSDIDHQVTEEHLATLFLSCGRVVDCRICGDPNSVLRFGFIEFTDEDGARNALTLAGTMLGFYPVRVLPSKTAIAPVNPTFLPRSEDEREMCARTIYCTNIDNKVTQADVKLFFESTCGEVQRLRLLGDHRHPTRVAFVEFVMSESVKYQLGSLFWLNYDWASGECNCSSGLQWRSPGITPYKDQPVEDSCPTP